MVSAVTSISTTPSRTGRNGSRKVKRLQPKCAKRWTRAKLAKEKVTNPSRCLPTTAIAVSPILGILVSQAWLLRTCQLVVRSFPEGTLWDCLVETPMSRRHRTTKRGQAGETCLLGQSHIRTNLCPAVLINSPASRLGDN